MPLCVFNVFLFMFALSGCESVYVCAQKGIQDVGKR